MGWLSLLAAAPIALASPADNGPEPTVAQAEQLVKARLADPYSAHFIWPYEFTPGPFKWPLSKTKPGWFTCGKVNAKNAYGGYVGENWFFLQAKDGQEVILSLDHPGKVFMDAESTCSDLIKTGLLKSRATPVQTDPTTG